MNLLDRLFSREIERRTGAHAITIYIESENARKRSRSRGKKVIQSANKKPRKNATKVTTKKLQGSFLQRIDTRFPWLKLFAVCLIGIIVVLDLCDLTISHTSNELNRIKIAPMAKHVRVTERVLNGKKLAALTFDDGPSELTTPRLLDTLKEKDAPATFFMLGSMTRTYPDIAKRIEKEGHIAASHTMYHQNLIRISANAAQDDINEAKATYSNTLGHDPTLVRPPYGNYNDNIRNAINLPIILWSVDTLDWKSKDVDAIVAATKNQIHDGAIILMHDIYPTTVDAVPIIIDDLRQDGYEFVTISELANTRGASLTPGTVYYNFRP